MNLKEEAEKIRKILNKRRKNIDLSFIEEDHLYFMRDENGMIRSNYPSVSKIIKKFYEEFDADGISLRMAKGDKQRQKELLKEWADKGTYATNQGSRVHYILEKELISQFTIAFSKSFQSIQFVLNKQEDELKKEEPDYLKIGLLAGTEAIGLIPGLGTAAKNMIRKGADMARQTDNVVDVASNVPKVAKEPFKKTRPAYRIATQSEDGKLYPLFVNADDEIPVGTWIDAKMPPIMFKGANGNMYVPSKGAKRAKGEKQKATGDLQVIPDEETAKALKEAGFQVEKPSKTAPFGKVRSVAARPGYHATTKPVAHHLGPEDLVVSEEEVQTLLKAGITPKAFKHKTFRKLDGKTINKNAYKKLSPEDKARVEETKKYYVKRRAEDQVFVEVDMADDTSEELAAYMKERNRTDINDKLPVGGSYSYVDGQADGETWVVGGNMRVNRVLSREEAKAAQEAAVSRLYGGIQYREAVEMGLDQGIEVGTFVKTKVKMKNK